jgi:hypothetical protein
MVRTDTGVGFEERVWGFVIFGGSDTALEWRKEGLESYIADDRKCFEFVLCWYFTFMESHGILILYSYEVVG